MDVADQIRAGRERLTPTERRVADLVLQRPQAIAFATVAEVAAAAGTSGATVVRLASKLGYEGFSAMQAEVQAGLTLRPATERIRLPTHPDLLDRTLAAEVDNLHDTFAGIDRRSFDAAVALLADVDRRVGVLFSESTAGLGTQVTAELGTLRPGVDRIHGTEVAVLAALSQLGPGDVLLAVDLPRYDRWLLDAARRGVVAGLELVALTDSELSPLGLLATHLTVRTTGTGPFDSHVALLAILGALVTGVATADRRRSAARLDRIEDAWRDAGALVDE